MRSTIRFVHQYIRPHPRAVEVVETEYRREGETVPARLYRPAGRSAPLPTWVVLHGLTWHGFAHRSLDRVVRAVAAGGAAVFVPEIPEWRRLRVAPAVTGPSIRSAVDTVCDRGIAQHDRIAVLGFSFGATQALVAVAADPSLGARLRAIAAWGGYYDLRDVFRFGLSGEFEHAGTRYRVRPDPYGGWIMGANYLTHVPGYESHADVARALARLADESGRRGVFAGDPVYDPYKRELRAALPPHTHAVFDVFAPLPGESAPDPALAAAIPDALARAAIAVDPQLDPAPVLPRLRVRTLLAHGRDDRLVPFTESLRLADAIPPRCRDSLTITSLFSHSAVDVGIRHPIAFGREALRFVRLLHRLLGLPGAPR